MTFLDSVLFVRTVVINEFDLFYAGQVLKADFAQQCVGAFGSVDAARVTDCWF